MSSRIINEDLIEEFRSSTKQSLSDIGEDFEEIDKIEFSVSESIGRKKLSVDYSDFSNHVFFGSGWWAINFALSRIFDEENGYPVAGELKDKNEWRKTNTDFENWWFDNEYPKQFGYVNFVSSSTLANNTWIKATDYKKILNLGTSSVTIEFVLKPYANLSSTNFRGIFGYASSSLNGYIGYLGKDGDDAQLVIDRRSDASTDSTVLNYNNYISSSHRITYVYNNETSASSIYVDGELAVTASGLAPDSIDLPIVDLTIGTFSLAGANFFFSGAIDDFRFYKSARPENLIKRNYYKETHANSTASLCVYYKFNELTDTSNPNIVIDYSGKGLHGIFTGSFSSTTNRISGTLGSWFKTAGDPIFNRANLRVSSSIEKWFNSGSLYDNSNNNFIFNLIPSFLIDDENTEDQQLFLLLLARHWDKLKLYIKHLAYTLYSNETGYNVSADELLNDLAKNYGIDIGDVYTSADALQYFYGEDVLTSGSLDNSLEKIRNQLRRNLVNNLSYIINTKSTREALRSSLRTLGLDDNDLININEYRKHTGSVETFNTRKVVERRALKLGNDTYVNLSGTFLPALTKSSGEPDNNLHIIEFHTLFNTASSNITSSLFHIGEGNVHNSICYLQAERENLTSSYGVMKLYVSGGSTISSSREVMFDNNWLYTAVHVRPSSSPSIPVNVFRLQVASYYQNDILFHYSASGNLSTASIFINDQNLFPQFGTSGSIKFDGYLREIKLWTQKTPTTLIPDLIAKEHIRDFESLSLTDYLSQISGGLKLYYKCNDYTSSNGVNMPLHNYAPGGGPDANVSGSGVSSSADYNFPGFFIEKEDPSYVYDLLTNNEKIRLRDSTFILNEDETIKDIPYISIDVSPISALNKEIVRWFGNLNKLSNIIGGPFNRYHPELTVLNPYSSKYFEQIIDNKLSYTPYLNILKWFDNNFTFFIKQLIPLDLNSSISNFSIEPNFFEFNKIQPAPPIKKQEQSVLLSASVTNLIIMSASTGYSLGFGDPGRFGSGVSASAKVSENVNFTYLTSVTAGMNYIRREERKVLYDMLKENSGSSFAPSGSGNGFFIRSISSSNHLKNAYGVIPDFRIEKIRFDNDGYPDTSASLQYFSAAWDGPSNRFYTGSLNGIFDSRWLYVEASFGPIYNGPRYDRGIGYSAGWGQLFYNSQKSLKARWAGSGTLVNHIGLVTTESLANIFPRVEFSQTSGTVKQVYLWPNSYASNGITIFIPTDGVQVTGSFILNQLTKKASLFGDIINIEDYDVLDIDINYEALETDAEKSSINMNWFPDVRFAFSNDYNPGAFDVEGIFSSSLSTTVIVGQTVAGSVKLEHRYALQTKIQIPDKIGGAISFSRRLPKAKFMRVFMEFITLPSSNTPKPTKFIITGRLSKGDKSDIDLFKKVTT